MQNNIAKILVEYIRDGLVEQEHFGFVVTNFGFSLGEDNFYPYFLRSCAKPLQASLLIDYKMDEIFSMTSEEIAICCASHAGEPCHQKVAQQLLNKIGIDKSYLRCGLHKPISKTEKEKMILNKTSENVFQNNCVGKHIMMLGLCKINGWNFENYDDIFHPLQKVIKTKIYSLCECKEEYPITKDGCGVPIHSMPLNNMVKGYVNLFSDKRYEKLLGAFLDNPYIIGGEDRTDTKIIQNSSLIAKVGAGGLLIVYNPELKKAFIVKISDCDMKAREFVALELIRHFGWGNIELDNKIRTLHSDVVGEIKVRI